MSWILLVGVRDRVEVGRRVVDAVGDVAGLLATHPDHHPVRAGPPVADLPVELVGPLVLGVALGAGGLEILGQTLALHVRGGYEGRVSVGADLLARGDGP